MARTRTGSFPIGFRRYWSLWQKDLPLTLRWAMANEFEFLDVAALPLEELKSITAAGLNIGAVELPQPWGDLASPDTALRRATAQSVAQYVKAAVALGAKVFFAVAQPGDPARPRHENFAYVVDGYGQLLAAIQSSGARVAFESWPGLGPHFPMFACTPADCRALLKELPGNAALNFDPSHLIRVGIDPVPFLQEFAPRVAHVHAKDTEILTDDLQEHGTLQAATFAPVHGGGVMGGHSWRYCLPGHGCANWPRILETLRAASYAGGLSIEVEDEHFITNTEADQQGLIASRQFLASA